MVLCCRKSEINDPNALSLATSTPDGIPSVRMVLLKGYNEDGLFSILILIVKKELILKNPNASMCFHWKSLRRQIRISGKVNVVDDKIADKYYNSRAYRSRIGAWASSQSSVMKKEKS